MLDSDTKVKCGWCGEVSTVKEWDDTTFSECKSREMRRAYKHLYDEKSFYRQADTYYKCPKCQAWSRGSQLKITDTDDKRLLSLGGEPIFTVNKE